MAHITKIPLDILNVILFLVATSRDGAKDLARIIATCKLLRREARKLNILKMVDFQSLTFNVYDFRKHHHRNDLLCLCAKVGNQAAQTLMGKAILVQDSWFMGMIFHDNNLAFNSRMVSSEVLHHHSLVRTFILTATSKEIVAMRQYMLNYVVTHAGFNAAREYGLMAAICCLCNVEAARHRVPRIGSHLHPYCNNSLIDVLALLDQPDDAVYRDIVVILFDKLFPSGRD